MKTSNHPEWAAVGRTVRVVRTFSHNTHHVVHEHTATVSRHTPTLIILSTGERFRMGHPTVPTYHLTPGYLDYRTVLAEATS